MGQDPAIERKKRDIVALAFDRFYEGGFHATGIDALMADSGISKRTLYKYFSSKEELIEAVLDHYATTIVLDLFDPVTAIGGDPRERILAFFDMRKALIDQSPTRGCLGVKAFQEFAGKHGGIEARGLRAILEVEQRFVDLCERAGFADPSGLGKQVNILFQGALLLSQSDRNGSAFVAAKAVVAVLLERAPRR